jgi:hypothetical protein
MLPVATTLPPVIKFPPDTLADESMLPVADTIPPAVIIIAITSAPMRLETKNTKKIYFR